MSWRDFAECRGMPTAWGYPDQEDKAEAAAVAKKAKQVCARCPVRQECAAEGMANLERGIWGGRSVDRALRERNPLVVCPECGWESHRLIRGMCARCYERRLRAKAS